MSICRDAVAGMIDSVRERADAQMRLLGAELPSVASEIPAIHFSEAMALITQATGEDVTGEPDLAPAHERWLCEWSAREHGSDFLFVTGFPLASKPFYTYPDPAEPRSSNGFDLLFRGMEIVTGGQRLHRHEDYLAALAARGERPEAYAGYLQVFEHGMPPHGGFALGLERWAARLTGAANVRQLSMFPRDLHRLSP
jgi:nondiscriminating aspartyl-tRNA synthetase